MKPLTLKTFLENARLLFQKLEFKNDYFGFIFILRLM